jgi:hypothetical protein
MSQVHSFFIYHIQARTGRQVPFQGTGTKDPQKPPETPIRFCRADARVVGERRLGKTRRILSVARNRDNFC